MSDNPLLSSQDARWKRPNPFASADGKNPFADDTPAASLPATDNPYEASLTPGAPAEMIARYETTQAHRGNLLLVLGGLSALALIASVVAWSTDSSWTLPIAFIAGVLSLITAGLSHTDLAAIKSGAMEASGQQKTLAAYWLSVAIATLLTCWLIYYLTTSIFSEEA